jgi:hypothetical protein
MNGDISGKAVRNLQKMLQRREGCGYLLTENFPQKLPKSTFLEKNLPQGFL